LEQTAAARREKRVKFHFGGIAGQIPVRCMSVNCDLVNFELTF
jgi:hypothetical protein